ncbi:MAG TPA: ATP-binding protein, partial [Flavisolibacter sp.]|nr:ATP-binding protein [Flavisolibacter sp.]
TLRQIIATRGNNPFFDKAVAVVETGQPLEMEYYSPTLQQWIAASIIRLDDGILLNYFDITNRKQTEQLVVRQNKLLTGILDASINSVFALEAVRNKEGEIIDFTFLEVNRQYAQLIGKKVEELVGQSYLTLLPPLKANGLFDIKRHVVETGEAVHKEIYFKGLGLDGWYDVSIVKLGDNGLVETFTNITESKLHKDQLKHSLQTLRNFIDTSQSALSLVKPVYSEAGEIVDFSFDITNSASAAFAGQTPDTIKGKKVSSCFSAYLSNGLFDQYKHTFVTGEPIRRDIHYLGDGLDAWLDIITTKMEDGVLITLTEFTQIKRLQLELEKKVEELKYSNANLEEFAYAASHDLQEPLRKIHFFSSRLKHELATHLAEDQQKLFDRMDVATVRMQRLIDDLLTYSRIAVKHDNCEMVNLSGLVHQVLQDLEIRIIESGASISMTPLPEVMGYTRQLRQMFQNLLSNALKYRKPDIKPTITIRASLIDKTHLLCKEWTDTMNGNYHLIEVIDNGIGFEQEHADKIFQVFQRLHGRSEYEGTGVGLAIVRKVVNNHQGFVTAHSKPGNGAAFSVILPA